MSCENLFHSKENANPTDKIKSYTIQQISDWFLTQESMSPRKLQKMTYYFQAWGNALYKTSIINNSNFEAWMNGPISPVLFLKYKKYGWNKIEQLKTNKPLEFDKDTLHLLKSVWKTYGKQTESQLDALSCSELPWINARKGVSNDENSHNIIKNKDMEDFYLSIYLN